MALFAEIAKWLGQDADATEWAAAARMLRGQIAAQLFDRSVGLFRDGLGVQHHAVHASIVAAATAVVEEASMADAVLNGLDSTGLFEGRVLTTCWIAGATLEGLYNLAAVSMNGTASDIALRYMSRRGQRSWTFMMDDFNATMTMEAWDPADNTGAQTGGEGITFAHPWCSGPAHVIPNLLMGVSPGGRGWATVNIRPQPGESECDWFIWSSSTCCRLRTTLLAPLPLHASSSC